LCRGCCHAEVCITMQSAAASNVSDEKHRIKAACMVAHELIGQTKNKSVSELPIQVQKLTPAQYTRWWDHALDKAVLQKNKCFEKAPLPEEFTADFEQRVKAFLQEQTAVSAPRKMTGIFATAKRAFGLSDDIAEVLLCLPQLQEVLQGASFDVSSIGLRCPHCCEQFQTMIQARNHAHYCKQNMGKRCSFCTEPCVTLDAKRNHEASCPCNPSLWCDWCNVKFPHQALRDKHRQRCLRDPCKVCSFCGSKGSTRAARVLHESFCAQNAESSAEQGECISCGEVRQCIRFPCGEHLYCGLCTLRLTSFALKDRSKLPLRCCKQYVQPGDAVDMIIAKILCEEDRQKYQEAMLQKVAKVVMYCPSAKCGALIALDEVPKSGEEAGPHGCPKCQQALCFACRSEWHAGMSCSRYQYLAAESVDETTLFCRQMGWMRCFECGHVVEKKGGCNHISCFCGAQFCYICGNKWGECKCQVFGGQHALRHNRANASTVQYQCPFCRQPYPSREEMRAHRRTCRVRLDQVGGAYECASCLDRFHTPEDLRVHRRRCRAAKNQTFECPECFDEHSKVARLARLVSKMLEMRDEDGEVFEGRATVQFRYDSQEILRRHRRMCGSRALCGECD